MTGPKEQIKREEALAAAEAALEHATFLRDRGAKIAEEWRKSRSDNNFRMMLRRLGRGAQTHAP